MFTGMQITDSVARTGTVFLLFGANVLTHILQFWWRIGLAGSLRIQRKDPHSKKRKLFRLYGKIIVNICPLE